MALIHIATPLAQLSGRVGGSVFSHSAAGTVLRSRPNRNSSKVQKVTKTKSHQAILVQAWSHTLTDAQRTAWQAASTTGFTHNGNSQKLYINGRSFFIGFNLLQLKYGAPTWNDPPTNSSVGTPTGLTIAAVSGGGGSIQVTNTVNVFDINDNVLIEASPAVSPGITSISSKLRMMSGGWPVNTTQDITAYWTGQFGSLPNAPGQKIFIRIRVANDGNGAYSGTIMHHVLFS